MPWQASPELKTLGGLGRSRLNTYYEAARAEAMVDVEVADQRYQALYGTPYEHGNSDAQSTERWQILAERAMPEPGETTQRRIFLRRQSAAAETSLWQVEDDIGKAVIERPPPIVTALLKGRPVDERLRLKDPRRGDVTNPRQAWERAAGAVMAYVMGYGQDPNSSHLLPTATPEGNFHFTRLSRYVRQMSANLEHYRRGVAHTPSL